MTLLDDEIPFPDEPPDLDDDHAEGLVAGVRRVRITWASAIEPEPVKWAWKDAGDGRIPAGSLSVAAGREGTGKSSCGIWLASQISRGTLPGCYYGTSRRVLYVAVEDSWKHTLVPRAMAAKADLDMIGRFEVITNTIDGREATLTLSLPHDNELLHRAIVDNEVALVVIDPLLSVIGSRIDTHRSREVRDALDPLVRIADETGAVIFGIAHFNKSSGTDASSLITGAGAFKDVPRSIFGFVRDDENDGQRIMSQTKNSLGRDDLPSRTYTIESIAIETKSGKADTGRFLFTGETDRTVRDVLRDHLRGGAEGKRLVADHFIAAYLKGAGGRAPANEVIAAGEAAGFKAGTIKNARGKVADTKSEGFTDKTHIWVLREEPTKSAVDHSVGHVGHTDQEVGPTGPTCDLRKPEPTSPHPDVSTPPGAPTASTPGMTDRVRRIVDRNSKPTQPEGIL